MAGQIWRLDRRGFHSFVLRPLIIFITFCLMVFAILQGTGRIVVHALHVFEPQINAALALAGVSVRGIRGHWHGLNPVLEVREVSFPAGQARQVSLELDVLESMLRSHFIGRRAHAESVVLHVDQQQGSWRLRGLAQRQSSFDFWPMLEHVDELGVAVSLALHGEDGSTERLNIDLTSMNHGGVHYNAIAAYNPLAAERVLQVQGWRTERIPGAQRPANTITVRGSVLVPQLLTGMPELVLAAQQGDWFDKDGSGGGEFLISVSGVKAPGAGRTIEALLSAHGERVGSRAHAIVDVRLGGAGDDVKFSPGPIYATLDLGEPDLQLPDAARLLGVAEPEPELRLWIQHLDLAEASRFFLAHLGGWEPAARWVRALDLAGSAGDIHVFADRELGFGFSTSMTEVRLTGYKGVPTVVGAQGRLWGNAGHLAMQVNMPQAYLHFPEMYDDGWRLNDVTGVLKALIRPGYFGMHGSDLSVRVGDTSVSGSYLLARPDAYYDQQLSLHLRADRVDLEQGRTFIPKRLPQALAEWLQRGPRQAILDNPQFAYHGQIHQRDGELARRLELWTRVSKGRVQYDERWPLLGDFLGVLHVAGSETRIDLQQGRSRAVKFSASQLRLHDNGAYLSATIAADTDARAVLDFVRNSPLWDNLGFITPEWDGSGNLSVRGDLTIPIDQDRAPQLAVELAFEADAMALAMPNYRLGLEALHGSGTFQLPHNLRGKFAAKIFDRPAEITTDYSERWLNFHISGLATPEGVYQLIGFDGSLPAAGQFPFDSVLSVAMDDGVTNLAVTSDLLGLALNLPAQFGKVPEESAPSELDVQFLADYQSVRLHYKDVLGWLHYDDKIARGALGVNAQPPMTAQDNRALLISGSLPELVLSDWVSAGGDSAVKLPLDWAIQGLAVDRFVIDELTFSNLRLNGWQQDERVRFEFDGPDLQGSVDLGPAEPLAIQLALLRLPAAEQDEDGAPTEPVDPFAPAPASDDPLTVEVGESLPAARVDIAELQLGENSFGAWRFEIVPEPGKVTFRGFGADVNGVHIENGEIGWDLAANTSAFAGRVKLDDLAQTLPKWNYAPSLSTSEASLKAKVAWPGSPINLSLLDAEGSIDFSARDGRFVDVEAGTGGLRILGLINFTKIASRINLDFSDVVGEGISYETIDARVRLDHGTLSFARRMTVNSSSGKFQVGGTVDLASGMLDNEMIVTLPLSKSLPWYGVYLALANPLAGLGVVVGERVLRKPIEQFSTAKYAVTGTLDDPQVDFVGLWDTSMKEAPESKAANGADPVASPLTEAPPAGG